MWYIAFKVKKSECGVLVSEHLRFAGALSTTAGGHQVYLPSGIAVEKDLNRQADEEVVVIHEPRGINGKEWARMNAERLKSFGICPSTFKQ